MTTEKKSQSQEINTFNKFFVGVKGDYVALMMPAKIPPQLTKQDAYLLAAYLVSMADITPPYDGPTFTEVLKAVREA